MPALPSDILDRIRRVEDALQMLAGRANIRPALDEILAGRVLIGEGGTLRVEAPSGQPVLVTGEFASGKYGARISRSDGTGTALVVGSEPAEFGQMIRIYPRGAGSVAIVMDDALHDGWLGRPWVPVPLPVPVAPEWWPSTTSSTWQTVAVSYASRQHVAISGYGRIYAEASTTGQMRVLAQGTQVGPTTSVTGTVNSVSVRANLPAGTWGELLTVEVQLQRTSGTGLVRGQMFELEGVNSID